MSMIYECNECGATLELDEADEARGVMCWHCGSEDVDVDWDATDAQEPDEA